LTQRKAIAVQRSEARRTVANGISCGVDAAHHETKTRNPRVAWRDPCALAMNQITDWANA